MKQKKMLALTFSQLKQIYNQESGSQSRMRVGCCVFWKFAG